MTCLVLGSIPYRLVPGALLCLVFGALVQFLHIGSLSCLAPSCSEVVGHLPEARAAFAFRAPAGLVGLLLVVAAAVGHSIAFISISHAELEGFNNG